METCDSCGTAIDYERWIWRIDITQWLGPRAVGRKLVFCSECGHRMFDDMLNAAR